MRKHTLLKTYGDEEFHSYGVEIGTDLGIFYGYVECREEDYKHESKYLGYELAEIKAEIEYARAKRDYWNAQAMGLNNFWKNMAGTRNYDANAYWVKQIRSEVDRAMNKRTYWVDQINALKNTYYAKIVAHDTMSKKLDAAKEVKV